MAKFFNVVGACNPKKHYMVNLESRLASIKEMVDREEYFIINKGRQYGKTTILRALTDYLKDDYEVISLDFQRLEVTAFENTQSFVIAFLTDVLYLHSNIPDEIIGKLKKLINSKNRTNSLQILFQILSLWCKESEKPIVLIIDEVDSASNNQVFLDFLAQLRAGYLSRDTIPTFQSVILAGVYDIRNIRRKIRPDEEHKHNSPWNIAAKFRIEMHFSKEEIKVMLGDYEKDYSTGMNIDEMSSLLYNYTSGYPYLVSWFCKCMDEELCEDYGFSNKSSAWTKEGFLKAHKILIEEKNPLFESLIGKFELYPELKKLISRLLFNGERISYNADDTAIQDAEMFGFIKSENSSVVMANRVFETRLYNYFLLSCKEQTDDVFLEGSKYKNQFIIGGRLNVRLVLEKFVETFNRLYGNKNESFLEDEGRKYFMLFLKPIINGVGNCYVETQTRDYERMDLVIDYNGEQSIVEMKIWHGDAYNKRGEEQLIGYLDYFGIKKGYMLSFNFNKKEEIGVYDRIIGDKILVEAIV